MWILYLIVFDFTRFRCAENRTPQDHFRCVMVCYCTCTPQKSRPRSERFFFFFFFFFFWDFGLYLWPRTIWSCAIKNLEEYSKSKMPQHHNWIAHFSRGIRYSEHAQVEQCTILFPGHIWFRKFFQITNDTVTCRTIRSWSIWFRTI